MSTSRTLPPLSEVFTHALYDESPAGFGIRESRIPCLEVDLGLVPLTKPMYRRMAVWTQHTKVPSDIAKFAPETMSMAMPTPMTQFALFPMRSSTPMSGSSAVLFASRPIHGATHAKVFHLDHARASCNRAMPTSETFCPHGHNGLANPPTPLTFMLSRAEAPPEVANVYTRV